MDYGFFDALIDSIFVINAEKGIVYCNEAAAKLCESSVKRLSRGKPMYETIEFSDPNLFVMPYGQVGGTAPAPMTELQFKLKSGKEGKLQIAIQPFKEPSGEPRWIVLIRDVTLEEVLHAKYHKQLEEKEVYIKKLEEAQKQLEAYSKNLEQMVEERTQEVKRANVMLNAIMNSLGQGFFVFDKDGLTGDFHTRACEEILEGSPAKRSVWDVLRVPVKDLETFKMWIGALFSETLPFENLKDLGPNLYPHTLGKQIKLEYYPLRGESGGISRIVVVATDKTSEHEANIALDKEKKFAKMIVKLVTGKQAFSNFLDSARTTINSLITTAEKTKDFDHELFYRGLHTLEGEAATYSAAEVWSASRAPQEALEPLKRGLTKNPEDVRGQYLAALYELRRAFDSFCTINSELFRLVGIGAGKTIELGVEVVEDIIMGLGKRGVSPAVQGEIESALLKEPMLKGFRHYQDVVTTVAERLNKKVEAVHFHGDDVRVFMNRYDELVASFVHAFRNAVDHGIEPAEEREMIGKPAAGKIDFKVERFVSDAGHWIRIKMSDDGRGVSPNAVKMKLREKFPQDQIDQMADFDVIQKIFDAGLSTKESVGEFSGRGIGLNAVKAAAEDLGGRAWVESVEGQGTVLMVEVPDLPRVDKLRMSA